MRTWIRVLFVVAVLSLSSSRGEAQQASTQAAGGECTSFSCFGWVDPFSSGFGCLEYEGALHFGICRATIYNCQYTPCSFVLRTRFDGTPIREENSCGQDQPDLVRLANSA